MINKIIKTNNIHPDNVKSIDFYKLARKSNSTSLLKKTEMPIFGIDIYKQYRKFYDMDVENKNWSETDDHRLKKAVNLHGINHFTHISQRVEGKHPMECYLRWFKAINMHRKTEKWTPYEDLKLGIAVLCYGSWNINEARYNKIRWIHVSRLF